MLKKYIFWDIFDIYHNLVQRSKKKKNERKFTERKREKA